MSATTIDLNCDLGERDDGPGIAADAALLELVTSANIACGGHAGDEQSMERTVRIALERGVAIGAHPGYPDRAHFGRVAFTMSPSDLEASIAAQLDSLRKIVDRYGARITHLKPHGALYHEAMRRREIAESVARAVAPSDRGIILVGQSGAPALDGWRGLGYCVAAEAFADRRYEVDGSLRSREKPDALITDPLQAAVQAVRIATGHGVVTSTGEQIAVQPETLCVHSDTPHAVEIARAVRDALTQAGMDVQPIRR
jgi:5-oxoprolinase (ATP-hydrolysing) subunit A